MRMSSFNPGNSKTSRLLFCLLLITAILSPQIANAQPQLPNIEIGWGEGDEGGDMVLALQILLVLTVLTMAPAILIMVTSFTRIVVVLSFIRNALATQNMPPNQVLVGLALFLTLFVMMPVWAEINEEALTPYLNEEIMQDEALDRAAGSLREFMFAQTRERDIALFVHLADADRPATPDDVPTHILIPAFVISELKVAFQIGFLLYVPFLVIDMIVASTLMSMGMLMLPPIMISLPFKILLFVLVDGWHLLVRSVVLSFN